MVLRDEEVPILRKYLLNGGVLLADDFWGNAEWQSFETEMKRVLPERHWVELPMSHPIFHCVFDLKMEKNGLQVQTKNFWRPGASPITAGRTRRMFMCAPGWMTNSASWSSRCTTPTTATAGNAKVKILIIFKLIPKPGPIRWQSTSFFTS